MDEILKACADAGFPATVVTVPVEEASEPAASLAADNAPDFYMASLAKAKEENNPVLLDFSAEWCSPCQQMIQEVFPDPRVAELLDRFVFITIDTDEYPALAQKFGVVAMPDMRILNPDGIEIRQLLGFHGVEDLSEELTQVLEELKE